MNLTEQMLLRELLAALRVSYDLIPVSHHGHRVKVGKLIIVAENELSAILCLNCQESVNACQCEHTSAERAA